MQRIADNINNMKRDLIIPPTIVQAPIGILTFSSDWKINYINEIFIKYAILYQFEHENLEGTNIFESRIFSDVDLTEEFDKLKNGLSFEKEIKNISTLDGGKLTVFLKGSPLLINNQFSGGILILEDFKTTPVLQEDKDIKSEQIINILSRINDLLFVTDSDGKIKYSFGKSISKLNVPLYSLNELPISHFFTGESRNKIKETFDAVLIDKKSKKIIIHLSLFNKEVIYECNVEPLVNWRGKLQFLFFFFTDITEYLKETKLLQQEIGELKQYQVITEAVTDAVFAVNSSGNIIFWNRASESLFGYSRSEVYGKFFGKVLDVFDTEYFEGIKVELKKTKIWKITLTVYKKTGLKEIIDAKFSLADETGETILILCTDITERANTEQELKTSAENYKNLVSLASELICNVDVNGNIIFANDALKKTFKYSEEEIFHKTLKDLLDPHYIRKTSFNLKDFEKIDTKKLELIAKTKYNELIYLDTIISPAYQNNIFSHYNLISTEVSGAKALQQDLKTFHSMFEVFQDGVAIECDGKIVMSNSTFTGIFGYQSEKEILGKNFSYFVAENDVPKVSGYVQLLSSGKEVPERFEFMGKGKDYANFFAELSISSFLSEGKKYLVFSVRDITEWKRAQQAIKNSEEKYRNLTENIDDFLFTFERTGNTLIPVFYTSSVEKITGYKQIDLLGDSRLIFKMIYPDDFSLIKKKLNNLLHSKIQLSGEFELRIINRHGNIVWVRCKINLLRDKEGNLQKVYGLVSDISLRKKAEDELTKSTDNLIKLNETKDRFISIISHDLRTPFSSILGFTDLLLSDTDLSESEKKQYIEYIQESSKSMLSLVNSLLDWTRLQTGRIRFEPERIELFKIIESSLTSLSGVAFQKNIEITSDIQNDVFVFVDKDLIQQVFNNLLTNAIKFTPRDGKIRISVAASQRSRFLEFSIKDTGIGIKPENLKKLFRIDTKYTSEGTEGEKGTGLGLSLVKEIIEKHSGTIRVESEYGKGSDFKFTLPIASANILLVDNNKTDRLLYSKILKNITPDYNIELASDGKEALDKIISSPPALVITEHIMPKMDGYNLVLELMKAEIKGKPPVIVLSSEIDRNANEEYIELGVDYVFHKPVDLTSFKHAVEKSLRKGLTSV